MMKRIHTRNSQARKGKEVRKESILSIPTVRGDVESSVYKT